MVCSNLVPTSPSSSSISIQCYLAGFLSRNDSIPDEVYGCLLCLKLLFWEIYDSIQQTIHTEKHAVQQYIKSYLHTTISSTYTILHSCSVVWIILAAVAVSAGWWWVMQFRPEAGNWQLHYSCLSGIDAEDFTKTISQSNNQVKLYYKSNMIFKKSRMYHLRIGKELSNILLTFDYSTVFCFHTFTDSLYSWHSRDNIIT